uniref:Si:ch211-250c4.4 n=1 Tax=Kryptolebias marmoratus TaxID=37003 RepID=A0A3Q3BEL7_KRYMA
MSIKRKKAGLVISWQKPFSILTPWRKERDAVLNNEVVLTKMKVFNNFRAKLPMGDDSVSTISTVSASEQDIMDPTKTSEASSHLEENSEHPQPGSGSDYLSAIFSDSQLPRLYKFESEDSGVELPSGANSPSTPTGSEQSFVVHSRESSCDSCNLNPEPNSSPHKLVGNSQNSEVQEANNLDDSLNTTVDTQNNKFEQREEISSSSEEHIELYIGDDMDQSRVSGINSEEDNGEKLEQFEEAGALTEMTCSENETVVEESSAETCKDTMDNDVKAETLRRSSSSDSLKDYMDKCCKLSESSPLGSGLGYLEHICQLLEKIGHLQEMNLQLQRQLCSLQKDGRMTKTKEQHCSCGAATLSFQKRPCRSEFLSPSGTFSDLSTIPEVSRHSLMPTRRLWRRSLNRRSYTEGEDCFLGDNSDGLSTPQRRLSENYTWGRVKDIVRKTKFRNQSRLGLTSPTLKMSCPQLYPDLDLMEPAATNRNSMIALGHQSKLDFWIP